MTCWHADMEAILYARADSEVSESNVSETRRSIPIGKRNVAMRKRNVDVSGRGKGT